MNVQTSSPQILSKEARLTLMMINPAALSFDWEPSMCARFEVASYTPPQVYIFAFRNVAIEVGGGEVGKRGKSFLFGEKKEKEKEKGKEKPGGTGSGGTGTQSDGQGDDRGQQDNQGTKSKKIASRI